ncbi:DUF3618 domain-containing protein [Arthrobacter sp. I2-34]|uniref:DUF3618 domain-containing protein n=1 Tax=Arthrobacter hankyongi TaxID=2904801 RepID=A0ABS9L9J8_9MICC|nr:DUF3618 domain-containing protein [Arthrobacter hankyongi]MCG2623357.1 DUF3618 domain-containing protein [Arthrobacter hankyongi]
MSQTPEEIRADIEATRGRLGSDVDAVADKVTPSRIMHRQTDKVKTKFEQAKERVMGSAQETGHSLQSTAHDVGDTVGEVPHRIARRTSGNPIAAGLIAFGVGWLVSTLVPPTEAEQQAAAALKAKAQPLVEEVKESARQIGEDMKEPARQAAEEVKASAQDATDRVKAEGSMAAEDVKLRAEEARTNVQQQQPPNSTY